MSFRARGHPTESLLSVGEVERKDRLGREEGLQGFVCDEFRAFLANERGLVLGVVPRKSHFESTYTGCFTRVNFERDPALKLSRKFL